MSQHIRQLVPRPGSSRPPREVLTDLSGPLRPYWPPTCRRPIGECQAPKAMGPTPSYAQPSASAAPPNRRSIESSFGTAPSLLPPHSQEREYADHTFLGGGKCVLTRKRRNFHWDFLERCCSCLHLHLGGSASVLGGGVHLPLTITQLGKRNSSVGRGPRRREMERSAGGSRQAGAASPGPVS